jgi:hypothetical protein
MTKEYIGGKGGDSFIQGLHSRITTKFFNSWDFSRITGLVFHPEYVALGIPKSGRLTRYSGPSFQIRNLRLVSRVGPNGNQMNQVIFSILQRSGIIYKNGKFAGHYQPGPDGQVNAQYAAAAGEERFELRGGCTLIFDLDTLRLKYAISKPIVDMDSLGPDSIPSINKRRVKAQYDYQHSGDDDASNEFALYFGEGMSHITEPFAFLHQH